MRHYEIVFIVHPDQSEQVPAMVERYRTMVDRPGRHGSTASRTGAGASSPTRSRRSTRRTTC